MRRQIPNVGHVSNVPVQKRHVENVPHGTSRAGFTLLEMFVSVVVFGTALLTFLPMIKSVGNQQRFTEQRLLALREAENLLEQLAPRLWNELTKETLASQTLSDEAKSRLPQPTLKLDVTEPDEPKDSKRVTVHLSWLPRSGQAAQSIQLSAWFFRTEERP